MILSPVFHFNTKYMFYFSSPLDGIDDKIAAFDITMHSLGAPRRRAPTFSGYSDIPRRRAYFNGVRYMPLILFVF